MSYIGYVPAAKPLTSADITDDIIVNADINSSAAIAKSKLNLTGTIAIADLSATGTPSSTTFLRGDNTWGSAGAAAGQIIQVVTATDSTSRSTTSTSYVTGSNTLSASITPSSSSNKIFVIVNSNGYVTATGDERAFYTIYRGATNLTTDHLIAIPHGGVNCPVSMSMLDSPSTTSSTTYQVYFKVSNSAVTGYLNNGNVKGSITLFEVKG